MPVDWIVLAVGYLAFLVLSRGVLDGATKALSQWGGATARTRRAASS